MPGPDPYDHKNFKTYTKKHKIGSDAFIQLSYQIAYRLVHNDTVSVYEACSTAVYQHGRTETIRPATIESNDLVETYLANLTDLDDPIKRAEIKDKLLIAIRKHNSITKKAIAGHGFDRHLFALKYYAQKNGIELVSFCC